MKLFLKLCNKVATYCRKAVSSVRESWQALSLRNRRLAVGVAGAGLAAGVQAFGADPFVTINATTGFMDFNWSVPIAALLNNIAAIFIGVLPIVLAGITLAWGYALMQGRLKKK